MQKKKILIISTSLFGGGAEKVLVDYLMNIDYTKYEVHLNLEYNWGISYREIPSCVKITYRYTNTQDWRCKLDYHLYKLFRLVIFEPSRIRRQVDTDYDAIISFVEGKPLKFHRYVLKRGKKNISWVHCDFSNNHYTLGPTLSAKHEIVTYLKMDNIVCVSKPQLSAFKSIIPVREDQLKIIYNPVDSKNILIKSKSVKVNKKRFTIVWIGRLSQEKGCERILNVAKQLNDSGKIFDLWILGDGAMAPELKAFAKHHNLSNVQFIGFKNPPYPWLANADILVNTSYSEAAPVTINEALSLGIPVVATDTSGAQDLLEGGKWGIIVDQSIDSLYSSINRLMENPTELMKYKSLAAQKSKSLNVDKSLSELYKLID